MEGGKKLKSCSNGPEPEDLYAWNRPEPGGLYRIGRNLKMYCVNRQEPENYYQGLENQSVGKDQTAV